MPLEPPPPPPRSLQEPPPAVSTHQDSLPPDLVPGLLPAAQVHLLSGASGVGKTCLTAQLIAALQGAIPFLGFSTRTPASIAFVAADRDWDDHAQWLTRAGAAPVHHYSLVNDPHVTGALLRQQAKGGARWLFEKTVQSLWPPKGIPPTDTFLVLDPMALYIGGDILSYFGVYSHMLDINQWARDHLCTVLGLVHAGKQKGDPSERYARPQDRVAGTTAQTATVSSAFHLAPPTETDGPFYEFTWVPRKIKAGSMRLNREPNAGLFTYAPGARTRDEERQGTLLPLIAVEPLVTDTKSIVEQAKGLFGISRQTVTRHIKLLVNAGEVKSAGWGKWTRRAPGMEPYVQNTESGEMPEDSAK